ncbi:MAG: ABC transporter permease [Betaproteobacteria bacterium]
MALVDYFASNWPKILWLTWQHITIVGVAVGLAIVTGIPLGIAAAQNRRLAGVVLYVASIIMTIPSMALFGVLIPVLALINRGIGYVPAVIAIFLYSQLPIISNTYAAFRSIDPAMREAAHGMGMTRMQRLRLVETPMVLPIIMAGVRTAIVLNIGIAAIAAYIGAGGLGLLIRTGITQTDTRQILAGAIAVSVLALLSDRLLALLQRRLTSPGLLPA